MEQDPNFNKTYEIIGCFCDNKAAKGITMYENVTMVDYTDWRRQRKLRTNRATREIFFAEVVAPIIADQHIDLMIMSGFMMLVPKTFLDIYPRRIINIHPADLGIIGEGGKRKYTGANAVQLAMDAGERITSSTIHFAEEEPDAGEIIWISDGLPVVSGRDAKVQQELMKTECDGPALAYALTIFARGGIKLEPKK